VQIGRRKGKRGCAAFKTTMAVSLQPMGRNSIESAVKDKVIKRRGRLGREDSLHFRKEQNYAHSPI